MAINGSKWLCMAGIAGYGLKWQEIAGQGLK